LVAEAHDFAVRDNTDDSDAKTTEPPEVAKEATSERSEPEASNPEEMSAVDKAFDNAAQTVSGLYRVPYLTHAAMEPLVATAHYKEDGSLEIWAPVQYSDMVRGVAAAAAGIEADQVTCHQTLLGGAFGRKG